MNKAHQPRGTPGRPVRPKRPGWLTADEISLVLPYGAQWVRRHLRHLAHQFTKRDLRWLKSDVDAWLGERGLPPYDVLSGNHSITSSKANVRSEAAERLGACKGGLKPSAGRAYASTVFPKRSDQTTMPLKGESR
jgi:hypothetical protein